ncbi:MAG: GDSL-type esterase/lipase family protein [Cyanobacteria bacterium J06560_2]
MNKSMRWSVGFISVLTILLGFSVMLNATLFKRAKAYYTELNAVRLDPIGLSCFDLNTRDRDTQLPEVPVSGQSVTRFVFVGDSRASSWPSPVMEGAEFINRGVGSQTTTQVLQRYSAHVSPLKPDVVIVQVGINDLKTIGLFPDRLSDIIADAQTNIEQIVKQAMAQGSTVVLIPILPAGEISLARRPFWSDQIDAAVLTVNQQLLNFAKSSPPGSIIWFDGYSEIVDERGRVSAEYQKDELHLNDLGYEVLNKALVEKLSQLNLRKTKASNSDD